ncbi:MAG: signal peptidase II [candidate division Zixibacteria bacterium HGW-Zixibacteria-1]|nr:MAG: signal peptidase II [candidate division Zixibacteria bacterium HGW-Zixibacteria-1]
MPGSALSVKKVKRRPRLAGVSKRHLLIPLLTLAVVVIADQLTKLYALGRLIEGQPWQVLGTFFQLKLIFNKGGALGTDFGSGIFYLVSSLLILLIVIYFIYINRHNLLISLPMAAVAGGAVGNIIDRIRFGKVVDFLDFDFFDINMFGLHFDRWWVFNIADASITIGVIILLIFLLFLNQTEPAVRPETDRNNDEIPKDFTQ